MKATVIAAVLMAHFAAVYANPKIVPCPKCIRIKDINNPDINYCDITDIDHAVPMMRPKGGGNLYNSPQYDQDVKLEITNHNAITASCPPWKSCEQPRYCMVQIWYRDKWAQAANGDKLWYELPLGGLCCQLPQGYIDKALLN